MNHARRRQAGPILIMKAVMAASTEGLCRIYQAEAVWTARQVSFPAMSQDSVLSQEWPRSLRMFVPRSVSPVSGDNPA
jgi:hypothetical protein